MSVAYALIINIKLDRDRRIFVVKQIDNRLKYCLNVMRVLVLNTNIQVKMWFCSIVWTTAGFSVVPAFKTMGEHGWEWEISNVFTHVYHKAYAYAVNANNKFTRVEYHSKTEVFNGCGGGGGLKRRAYLMLSHGLFKTVQCSWNLVEFWDPTLIYMACAWEWRTADCQQRHFSYQTDIRKFQYMNNDVGRSYR